MADDRRGSITSAASGESVRNIDDEVSELKSELWKRQVSAILGWANTFLAQRHLSASSLGDDFHDGVLLMNLLEVAYRVKLKYTPTPKLPFHKLDNVANGFEFVRSQGVVLLSVDTNDFLKKREKIIMNVLWNVLRNLTIRGLRNMLMGNAAAQAAADQDLRNANVRQTLLTWAGEAFKDLPNVQITDFWKSFQDGIAFCAIVEHLAPGNIDISKLRPENARENLELAFKTAEQQLGIPALLSPEDFDAGKKPDEKSVENYVCMLVSAAQARTKKESEVNEMKVKMEQEKAKKLEEVQALKQEVEKEKKQFESLQADVEKLRSLHEAAFKSETTLKGKLEEAEAEKTAFFSQLDALKKELQRSHEAILMAHETEKLLHQREEELQSKVKDRDDQLRARDAEIERLNAELYKLHKEHENLVQNFRSDLKDQTLKERQKSIAASEESLNELIHAAQRESKSANDFLSAMKVKTGWLMKRRPGKEGGIKLFGGTTFKKRFFELKGDTLFYYKEKGSSEQGKVYLGNYQKIEFEMPNADPAGYNFHQLRNKRSSVVQSDEKKFVLRLIPLDGSGGGSAKVLELEAVDTMVLDLQEDIFTWVEEINNRIALINYLDEMFNKKKQGRHCREIVEFITDTKMTLLKIENKASDVHEALKHFKETLIMRKGLSIKLDNVALADESLEILAEILVKNHTVESVELQRNLLTAKGMEALGKALKVNTSVKVLRLDFNSIKDAGVAKLADGLAYHKELSVVSLCGNSISDAGVEALCKGIQESSDRIRRPHIFPAFELSNNVIGDGACRAVAKLLQVNDTITTVNLDHNLITDAGATELCKALSAKKSSVTSVDVSYNQISSKGVVAFAETVKAFTGTGALSVNLSHNKLIGQQGIEALLKTNLPLEYQNLSFVRPAK